MDLPDNILYNIFHYCDLLSIYKLTQCNKYLYNLIDFEYFTKLNIFIHNSIYRRNETICVKQVYNYIRIDSTTEIKHGLFKRSVISNTNTMLNNTVIYVYKRGRACGPHIKFELGNNYPSLKCNYDNNQLHGLYQEFHNDGTLKMECMYDNNNINGIAKYYANNKLIKEKPYNKGILNGLAKKYYSSGELRETMSYVDGIRHGMYREYYKSGMPEVISQYHNGYRHGYTYEYYTNSRIYKESYYERNTLIGLTKIYNKQGEFIKTIWFDSEI